MQQTIDKGISCNLCSVVKDSYTSCLVSLYAYSLVSPCPHNELSTLSRLSSPMGLGTGYKVAACQALHLTRRYWLTLPEQLTLFASVTISRDRLNLHSPFRRRSCSVFRVPCRSPRFCVAPFGNTSIHHVFFRRKSANVPNDHALFSRSLEANGFLSLFNLPKFQGGTT